MRARQTFKEQARGRVRKMRLRKRCCGWSHHIERGRVRYARGSAPCNVSRYALGAVRTQRAVARVESLFHARIRYTLRGPENGAVRASTYTVVAGPLHLVTAPARPSTAPTYAIAERLAARRRGGRDPGGTAPDSRSPIPAARGPRDVQLTCSAAALVEKPARPDSANSSLERSSPSVCRSRVAGQASLDVCEAGYALLDFRVERRRS